MDNKSNTSNYSRGTDDAGYIDDLVIETPESNSAGNIAVGEKIRELRELKGLTRDDLAKRADMSESDITLLEDEMISPNLGTMIKVAKALDMKMGTLISPTTNTSFTIVRADERKIVSRYASKKGERRGYSYQHLAFDKGPRTMEPFLITLEPAIIDEEKSTHDGEEFIFVLSGQMETHIDDRMEILNPGDSI